MARTRSSIFDMELNVRNNFKEMITDTDVLQKSVKNLAKTASFNVGSPKDVSEMLSTTVKLNNALAKSSDLVTGAFDLSKFNSELKNSGLTLNQVYRDLNAMGQEGRQVFSQLTTAISTAEAPLKRSSNLINGLGTSLKNTAGWLVASSTINTVAKSIQQAFNYAQSLDKSLNNIQIVTGHSAEYMKDFAIQANKAAKELNASTLEYTNAALIYYQQGLSDQEVAKRTATTVRMAQVTGDSMAKVSSQMTSIWNNFSTGIDNLERYGDVMANLGAHTASSSREIASGLEKFAAIGNTIGLSYDYAATAMATIVAQSRQSADSVGTSLKTLFSRLESLKLGKTLEDGVSLNKYSEALMKVGVNVLEANGKLRDMDSILNDLGKRWDTLTKAQQVALAQTVGGVRNYTTLVSLMENWETFQENLVTAQTAEGTLQRQADIYATSWEAAQKRVKTSAESIYNTLISSDFFKGLNNIGATILDQLGEVGKTLGTSGSLSGLGMIAGQMFGEQIAGGIDNALHNISVMTPSGFKAANLTKLESMNWLGNVNTKNPNFFTSNQIELNKSLQALQSSFSSMSFSTSAARNLAEAQIIGAQNLAQESLKSLDAFQMTTQKFNVRNAEFRQSLLDLGFSSNNIKIIMSDISTMSQTTGIYAGFEDTFRTRLLGMAESAFGNLPGQTDEIRAVTSRALGTEIENYLKSAGLPLQGTLLEKKLGNAQTAGSILYKLANNQPLDDGELNELFKQTSVKEGDLAQRRATIVQKALTQYDQEHQAEEWTFRDFKNLKTADGKTIRTATELAELANKGELNVGNNMQMLQNRGVKKYERMQQMAAERAQLEQRVSNLVGPAATDAIEHQRLKVQEGAKQLGIRQSIDEIKNSFISGTRNVSSFLGLNTGYRQAVNEKGQLAYRRNGELVYATPGTRENTRLAQKATEKDSGVTIENATASIGEFGVTAGMAAQSTAMAVSSVTNFAKSVEKGEATFTGFATALGSVGMMVGQNLSLLKNNTLLQGLTGGQQGALGKGLGSLFNKMGATGLGGAEGVTMAGAGVTAAAVAATVASIYSIYKNAAADNLENRTIKDKELNIQASSIAKEDKQKFDAFEQAINEQQASVKQLSQLQQGTAAYTSTLLKANEQARAIIDTYGLNAGTDYTVKENGLTTFSFQQIQDIYQKAKEKALESAYNATLTQNALDMDYSIRNLQSYGIELEELISSDQLSPELNDSLKNLSNFGSRINVNDFRQSYINDYITSLQQRLFNELQQGILGNENLSLNDIINGTALESLDQEEISLSSQARIKTITQLETEKQQIEEILENIQNAQLAQEANFQTAVNAYMNQDNEITSQEKAIARSLTVGAEKETNLEKYIQATQQDSSQAKFLFFHKTNTGEVFDKNNKVLDYKTLDDQYYELFHKHAPSDMENYEIAVAIRTKMYSNAIQNMVEENKTMFTGANISDSTFTKFANASDLSFKELINLQNETGIFSEEGKITSAGKLLFEPVLKEYVTSLDTLNNTISQNSLMTDNYLGKIVESTQFSASQLVTLNAYTSTIGANFGDSVGKYVFEQLVGYNDEGQITGWNQDFVKVLEQLDLNNSITGLASTINQMTLLEKGSNENLSKQLNGLKETIYESLEAEGGLAKAAFKTSDMQSVVNTIASALMTDTNITTGDIAKLAKKNATLSAYLGLSEDGIKHYQSVIDISTLLAEGKITTADLTSGLSKGIEMLGGVSDFQQAGLDTLTEQNLGTSYGELDTYWQNIGKSWAVATKQNIAHDMPFFTAMQDILFEEQFRDFRNLMESSAGLTTKEINKRLETEMPEVYKLLSTTAGKGKYFGKGGGGIETSFAYFGSVFGDQLAKKGLVFDEKTGEISFNQNFEQEYANFAPGQEVTSIGLYEYIKQAFSKENLGVTFDDKQIETFAKQITGYIGATDLGYMLDIGNAAEALNTSISEFNKQGFVFADSIDALTSLYDLGTIENLTFEDGKFRELTKEEKDQGQQGLTKEDLIKYFQTGVANIPILSKATESFKGLDEFGQRLVKDSKGTINVSSDNYKQVVTDVLDQVMQHQYDRLGEYTYEGAGVYGRPSDGKTYYDYDELKTFLTENQGYSSQDADKAIKELIDTSKTHGVLKTYTDAYGRQHNIFSNGSGEDFQNEVTGEDKFGEEAFENRAMEKEAEKLTELVASGEISAANAAKQFNEFRDKLFAQNSNNKDQAQERERQSNEPSTYCKHNAGKRSRDQKKNSQKKSKQNFLILNRIFLLIWVLIRLIFLI